MALWDEQPAATPADEILGGLSTEIEKDTALSGQVVSRERAEETAEAIRGDFADIGELARRAWDEEHWRVLEYPGWVAYVDGEFGANRVEARRVVAHLLSGEGMSQREIAAVTGVPRSTVQDDLRDAASPDVTRVADVPATPFDQYERNEVKRSEEAAKPRPKPVAQRVREHRDRRRQHHEDTAVAPGVTVTTPAPPAPDELAELRSKVTLLESVVESLTAEKKELTAQVSELGDAEGMAKQITVLTAERDHFREQLKSASCGHDAAWHQDAGAVLALMEKRGFRWDRERGELVQIVKDEEEAGSTVTRPDPGQAA